MSDQVPENSAFRTREQSLETSDNVIETRSFFESAQLFFWETTSFGRRILSQLKLLKAENERLQKDNAELERKASTDRLTGLESLETFKHNLDIVIARADKSRSNINLAVLYVDIDEFKKINDTYTDHSVGDSIIQQFVALFTNLMRKSNHTGRHGGDEFLHCIEDIELDNLELVLQRTLEAIENHDFVIDENTRVRLTASIGVRFVRPGEGRTATELIKSADNAMYQVKKTTRNGFFICCADDSMDIRSQD